MAEQNENKEKKGIAAWWAGLAKGAKIGISAGAAVLVAGAVVGTVFGVKSCSGNKGGDGGSKVCTYNSSNDEYRSEPVTIKKGFTYNFVCTLDGNHGAQHFYLAYNNGEQGHVHFKSPIFEGPEGNDWASEGDDRFGGSTLSSGKLSITITATEDFESAIGTFKQEGQ